MSKNLYDATILQLKGRALEAYATLDMLFTNLSSVPDHTAWVEEIVKHTRALAENENAMLTLQQYFAQRFTPPVPAPGHPPPVEEPMRIEPEKQVDDTEEKSKK